MVGGIEVGTCVQWYASPCFRFFCAAGDAVGKTARLGDQTKDWTSARVMHIQQPPMGGFVMANGEACVKLDKTVLTTTTVLHRELLERKGLTLNEGKNGVCDALDTGDELNLEIQTVEENGTVGRKAVTLMQPGIDQRGLQDWSSRLIAQVPDGVSANTVWGAPLASKPGAPALYWQNGKVVGYRAEQTRENNITVETTSIWMNDTRTISQIKRLYSVRPDGDADPKLIGKSIMVVSDGKVQQTTKIIYVMEEGLKYAISATFDADGNVREVEQSEFDRDGELTGKFTGARTETLNSLEEKLKKTLERLKRQHVPI